MFVAAVLCAGDPVHIWTQSSAATLRSTADGVSQKQADFLQRPQGYALKHNFMLVITVW